MGTETIQKQIAESAYPEHDKKELRELIEKAIENFFKKYGVSIVEGKLYLPKNYIIDTSYSVIWSLRDFENTVSKLLNKIHTGRLGHDEYFRYLTRLYNDQSVVLDKNTTLEPLDIGRRMDRITFNGVRTLLLNWIGISQKPISHAAIGDGAGLSHYGISSLFHEINRVPIAQSTNGAINLRGETLFVTASYSAALQSFTVKEAGITDGGNTTDEVQLYIQFDGADQKPHTVNVDIPQFSTSANFCTI